MFMFAILKKSGLRWVCNRFASAVLLVLLAPSTALFTAAQTAGKTAADHGIDKDKVDHYYEPLPQETGAAGLKLMLRRLQTTGRLMQVDAHPDDEDGGLLTLEARGQGVETLLMTLTRGEGGQNKLGSDLFGKSFRITRRAESFFRHHGRRLMMPMTVAIRPRKSCD